MDVKKTLQHELKSNNNTSNGAAEAYRIDTNEKDIKTNTANNTNFYAEGSIIMDEVNFKYLKHVILKFLTSREVRKFFEFGIFIKKCNF